MRVWARVELLCVDFNDVKVLFDKWPVSLSAMIKFRAMVISRAMEYFENPRSIFMKNELYSIRDEPIWKIPSILHENPQ